MAGWKRATFKGKDVWVRVTPAGETAVDGGRVPMRYSDRPGSKVYRGGASGFSDVRGDVVEMDDGIDADAAPAKKSKGSGFGSAGTRTKAQAAAAAAAASELVASLPPGTAIAFTDGGCRGNPGPAGSGVRLELPDGRVAEACRSLGPGTNNVAELTAIAMALELLDEAGLPAEAPVAVLSDSKYSHGVLALGWKAKANLALITTLRASLKARPGVALHWVAGHAGVAGNESADALATRGVEGRTAVSWVGPAT